MESHPLNMAHQQHRRADAYLINHRYDDAMQCHHNAAEFLLDAMKSTSSSVALESITLQHSYHLKQKDLIKSKKEQYARIKKAMENIKILSKEPFQNLEGNDYSKLQVAIYRAIHETDSLLHELSNKKDGEQGLLKELTKIDIVDGKKTEKTRETVVEELQILSQNLHSLVEQLVVQVEVLKDENMTLKERVNYLEKERVRYLNLPSTFSDYTRNHLTEGGSRDFVQRPVPITSQPSKPTISALDRPLQQPHFDLSALKND